MEIILSLFLVGFILGTFYLHIEFWIDIVGMEHDEKIIVITLFTLPFFPIFGTIELIRRIPFKIKIDRK
jgi:hypothetical protein